ncbi:MAG: condensation domain-containing protein [Gordonia sp. (in: high G+C Gram-positive bacteria)]
MQQLRATALDEAFVNLANDAVMSVHFEVRVAGRLDADTLTRAIRTAFAAHPLSRARLRPASLTTRTLTWQIADEPDHFALEVTDEPADTVRARLQSIAPDLAASPPLLAALVREDGGDRLILNFHHAAFDGMSAVRFTTSIAQAYSGEPVQISGPPVEQARDLRALVGSHSIDDLMPRVKKVGKDMLNRRSIARIAPDGGARTGRDHLVSHLRFTAEEVAAISARRPAKATLNDIAIAAHALTIVAWNAAHDAKAGDSVSVLMPVNLRAAEWSGHVVSNFASYLTIFVPTDVDDLIRATEMVRDETTVVKDNGAAGWIVDILEPGNKLPAALKRGLTSMLPLVERQFVETTALSNLGRLTIGDFGAAGAVTEVWFSPPPLSPTVPIAVGVAGMGGELFVGFRGDRRALDQAALDRFAASYRQTLLG